MEYVFQVEEHALADFERYVSHLEDYVSFPETARKKAEFLREELRKVALFPHRFPRACGSYWQERLVRYCVLDSLVVFFDVDDGNKVVTVLRLLDYHRNLRQMLGE